jgi:cytoskeletal protein CcmA (bactofilin family)
MPTPSGAFLSRGVSINGSVKFLNELLIDGEVEGTIDSTGTLTIGEHARIHGDISTKSVKVRGTVEGNIFVTERCELQAGSTLHGDIEAPRLLVDENARFLGSAKVGRESHSQSDVRLPRRTQSATQLDTRSSTAADIYLEPSKRSHFSVAARL